MGVTVPLASAVWMHQLALQVIHELCLRKVPLTNPTLLLLVHTKLCFGGLDLKKGKSVHKKEARTHQRYFAVKNKYVKYVIKLTQMTLCLKSSAWAKAFCSLTICLW